MCLKFNSLASAPASVVLPLPFSPHTHIPHFIYRLRIYRQFRICFTNASGYAHTLIIAQKPQKINLRFLHFCDFSVKNNREKSVVFFHESQEGSLQDHFTLLSKNATISAMSAMSWLPSASLMTR